MSFFEINNIHQRLMKLDIMKIQDDILENFTDEFDLNSIFIKWRGELYNYSNDELKRICQTAIENLLVQGKIKVGSSIGNFIVVQPINDIEQETEAKTDNEIRS